MPLNTDAEEELNKLKEPGIKKSELRERFDTDFGLLRGDPFVIPAAEGKWESVTSNRSKSEGWKIINILGSALVKIAIAIIDEKERERREISNTEKLVYGMLHDNDLRKSTLPEYSSFHQNKSFFAPVRGWTATRCMVLSDDEGKPYLDLAEWDIRNTYWVSGKRSNIWVCYERYATKAQVQSEYKGWNGDADKDGFVKVYDVYDCSEPGKNAQEGVIIGKEYVKPPTDIELGGQNADYLPIRIKACGGIPLIRDDNNDNIKKVGESYLVNNRELHEIESRLLSYNLTRAGMEAKMPQPVYWDSTKGDLPPKFKNDPNVKGGFIFLDRGIGQELANPLPMTPGAIINNMLALIQGLQSRGGLTDIAFGEQDIAMTAFGVDILNHNTREHIWPFKLAIENDYKWIASEIVKQYKNGGFSETQFEGYDSKFQRFKTNIKPDGVVSDKEFECNLVVDELRDRSSHSAMAINEIQAGLISKREALDVHQLSQDPDKTLEILYQEMADMAFEMPLVKGFLQKVDDYADTKDPKKKFELDFALRKLLSIVMMSRQSEAQAFSGNGGMTARKAQPVLPANINREAQERVPR